MLERRERTKVKLLRRKKKGFKWKTEGEGEEDIIPSSAPSDIRWPSLPTQPQTMLASSENVPMMLQWSGEGKVGLHLGPLDGNRGALEPDARLGGPGEGEELRKRGEVRGPGLLPTHQEPVTASRFQFPRMLRQARVGDLVEGGFPGRGPEVTWLDQWTGQGWAGPMGSVFFCSACQLAGGY